jgi:hypothetical protein
MNASDKARIMLEAAGYDWRDELDHHAANGVVYITSETALLAERKFDQWFIFLAVGRGCLNRLFALAPEPMPYVTWIRIRKGEIHESRYEWSKLQQRICHGWKT